MAEPSMELIGAQLDRLLREFAEMRATMSDLADGQTVLTHTLFRVERDIVQISGAR